jgi:hypothetical protein
MTTFTSEQYCTISKTAYQGLFEHDSGIGSITVKDDLITTLEVGTARARAELLKGGYAERWVSFQAIHINGIKQNDIINFKGINWIVKEIGLSFKPPTLVMSIKGVRYE